LFETLRLNDLSSTDDAGDRAPPGYSCAELTRYFLKLGAVGFGGPVALVGAMHRDLVDERHWISEADYKEGIALAQLAPGPLAVQLAIYLGYVHYRLWGATLAGLAFVTPSFLMVLALGWAYQHFNGLPWMQAVFYGVGASVIGIIAYHAYYLTRRTMAKDVLGWAIWLTSAACTIIAETEYVAIFLLAGLLMVCFKNPTPSGPQPLAPAWLPLLPAFVIEWNEAWQTRLDIVLFFTKAGAFVFGSGLAIVPFLYGGVVHDYGWLDERQFLDAVAVAMITPGPVLITVAFIGYLVAGLGGAVLAAAATFLPCYLFTVVPAPYFKRYGSRPRIVSFVEGVTAAATGAIGGAVVVLGRRTLLDSDWQPQMPKIAILAATLALLFGPRKFAEPLVVLGAALVGLAVFPFVSR
jgi:chromate transporter